jgi:hypothetical protein
MLKAIANDKLKEVKILHRNGHTLTTNLFTYAASCGSLDIMKWLHSQKCPFDVYTLIAASKYGDVENMRWLHEIECPCNVPVYIDSVCENKETMELVKLVNCPIFNGYFDIF